MAKTYVCIAYRWGWTNNHWYIVYAGDDENVAHQEAEGERDGRGGKYGVSILEFPEGKQIGYFASTYGEKTAYDNHRIALFERIGNCISGAIEMGEALLPKGDESGLCEWQAVHIPDWIRELHKRETETVKILHPEPTAPVSP